MSRARWWVDRVPVIAAGGPLSVLLQVERPCVVAFLQHMREVPPPCPAWSVRLGYMNITRFGYGRCLKDACSAPPRISKQLAHYPLERFA